MPRSERTASAARTSASGSSGSFRRTAALSRSRCGSFTAASVARRWSSLLVASWKEKPCASPPHGKSKTVILKGQSPTTISSLSGASRSIASLQPRTAGAPHPLVQEFQQRGDQPGLVLEVVVHRRGVGGARLGADAAQGDGVDSLRREEVQGGCQDTIARASDGVSRFGYRCFVMRIHDLKPLRRVLETGRVCRSWRSTASVDRRFWRGPVSALRGVSDLVWRVPDHGPAPVRGSVSMGLGRIGPRGPTHGRRASEAPADAAFPIL